jgi:cbb3-type cytochrome oxidase maturation protein
MFQACRDGTPQYVSVRFFAAAAPHVWVGFEHGAADAPKNSMLAVLVLMSVMLGVTAVVAFVWAARGGQFSQIEDGAESIFIERPGERG